MKKKYNCPAELTVDLIGGKWRVIVLFLLRKGPMRSGRLKAQLPGISTAAFSSAVRDLEKLQLIKRSASDDFPPQVSYELSSRGSTLKPIVKSLVKWGLANQNHYVAGEFGMSKMEAK